MNLYTEQKHIYRHGKQTDGYQGEREEGINWGMGLTDTKCYKEKKQSLPYNTGNIFSNLVITYNRK